MRTALLAVSYLVLSSCPAPAAEVQRSDGALAVAFPDGPTVTFALKGDLLLGLARASVGGIELTSPDTLQRPMLAQEFGDDRMAWPLMRLKGTRADGAAVLVEAELLGTTDEAALG